MKGGCIRSVRGYPASLPLSTNCSNAIVDLKIANVFVVSSQAAMMRHIAEQYAYPYGFANTKVSICANCAASLPLSPLPRSSGTSLQLASVSSAFVSQRDEMPLLFGQLQPRSGRCASGKDGIWLQTRFSRLACDPNSKGAFKVKLVGPVNRSVEVPCAWSTQGRPS